MAGSTLGSVVTSTAPPLKRSHSQPRVAACNLWSTGQFAPWKLQPQMANSSARSGTPLKTMVSAVQQRPSVGPRSVSTNDLPRKRENAPSRTSAPLFPDQILDNLYISDLETARAVLSPNYAAPGRPHIKYILTVLDKEKDMPKIMGEDGASQFVQKFIRVNDWTNVNLLHHLPEARDFIKQSLANNDGGVLVHCRKGVSRSGSVIVAYVMETLGLNVVDAIKHVVERRPRVLPNAGFHQQLKLWKELEFNTRDTNGTDKEQYATWKAQSVFRVC